VLDDNGLNLVGNIIEKVDAFLQMIVDFLAAYKFHCIAELARNMLTKPAITMPNSPMIRNEPNGERSRCVV